MKFFLVCLLFVSSSSYAKKGRVIMEAVDKRDTGKTALASYQMRLINKNKVKERSLLWWRLNQYPKTYNLIKIQAPKSLKSTGLLIHSDKKSDDQTWLFLSKAAKKEPRKISTSNKDSKFLGSEFYYADFEENGVDEFTHKYLKSLKVNQWDCDLVESTPKKKDYTYSKIISYVDKKTKVVVKAELYIKNNIEKVFNVIKLTEKNKIWTIEMSTMDNLKSKKKTELILNKIKYNAPLDKNFFTLKNLTRDF